MKNYISTTVAFTIVVLLNGCATQPPTNPKEPRERVTIPSYPSSRPTSSATIPNQPAPYEYRRHNEEKALKLFTQIDKDGDKRLTSREYLAYCIHRTLTRNDKFVAYYIKRHDKNGDGKLSLAEADKKDFDYLDLNHDHFLTAHELSVDMRGIHRRVNRVAPPTAEEVRAREIKSVKKEIRVCDTNFDGKISREEGMSYRCDQMSRKEFDGYDIDGDGYISVSDMMQYNANRSKEITVHGYADMPKEVRFEFVIPTCDVDLNSNLSMEEMTAPKCGFTKEDFIENDYDKDGRFTTEDLNYRKYLRAFHQANVDGDKGVSLEEYKKITNKPY